MARNSGGTYSLTAGQPVSSGAVISSTTFNTLTGDLATEMTDSLSRSGKGGMLSALRGVDGTVAAPALSFTAETGSGWFRESAGVLKAAILGTYRLLLNATGLKVNGTLETTGTSLLTGAVTASAGVVMNGAGSGSGQWARGNLPTVGQQVSSSCLSFSTTSATYVDVTNLTVTITTTGRPVLVMMQPDGSANDSFFQSGGTTDVTGSYFKLLRDATGIGLFTVGGAMTGSTATVITFPPGLCVLDVVGAGTYTYKLQAKRAGATDTAVCSRFVLVAYEL